MKIIILFLFLALTFYAQELKLEILNGHSGGGVLAVAVSPDGKFALTGSTDQTALLWDLETGKQLRRFFGYHEDAVSCVQFSKDGRFVLTASYDSSVQIWETATGKRVHGFGENRDGVLVKHSGKILSCAISNDMKTIATAGEDKTARLWDFETGKQLFELEHAGRVNSIAFSPDSQFLLTGGEDKIARLYATANGKEEKQFIGHTGEITSVAYSPDGEQILTGSEDKTARLWSFARQVEVRRFSAQFAITTIAFSPDRKNIVIGEEGNPFDEERQIRLWSIESEKDIWTGFGGAKTIVFIPNGKSLLLANESRYAYILELSSSEKKALSGFSDKVNSVAISPALNYLATAGDNNTSGFWSLFRGENIWKDKIKNRSGGRLVKVSDSILNDEGPSVCVRGEGEENSLLISRLVDFSPDGKNFIVEIEDSEDNLVYLFDTVDFKVLAKFIEPGNCGITSTLFIPNSDYIITSIYTFPLVLWNPITGGSRIFFNEKNITAIASSPDGTTAAVSYKKENISIAILNSKTRTVKRIINDIQSEISEIAFSPDGKTIATASGGEADPLKVGIGSAARANSIQFWDVETGREIGSFGGDVKISNNKIPGFKSVAFSPDGKYTAAGSFDDEVYLRNNKTGRVRQFEGHTDRVNSVKFAKDANGKLLVVSGSSDSTTRIWDAETGEEICALVTFRDGNWAVVQTETGRYDAPNGGEIDGIQWVFGTETIELKQLSAMYYTPNLLPRLLGYNKDELPKVVPLKDVKLYPEVVEQKFDAPTGKLNVSLKARNGGIGVTEIYVKGKITDRLGNQTETEKLVVADARDELLKQNPNVATGAIVNLSVELPPNSFVAGGENQIKVVTSNYLKEIGKGNIQSRGSEIVHLDEGETNFRMPTLYAIVGGTSDYAGDALDLRFAAKDAEDFANALQLGAKRLFGAEKVQITMLSTSRENQSEQPTKENFRRAARDIAKRAKPEDIFLLYLAGHGVTLGTGTDTYFYLTKEARSTAKTDLEANFQTIAVSNAEMMDWLTPDSTNPNDVFIQARKQVILLDTCAAGNFAREDWKKDREGLTGDQIRAMEFLEKKTGTFVLMGSAANAVSYEANNYNQGLLTYSLLEGMKGFALQKPTENVDVRLLFDYAEKRVETFAKGLGLEQRPLIKQPSGNTFVIGQMSEAEKLKIELAKEKPLMLRPALGVLPINNDPLQLIPKLRKIFDAESSYEVIRRRGEKEPQIVYVDDDTLPGGIRITGTYTVEGETVKIKAYLVKDEKVLAGFPEIISSKEKILDELLKVVQDNL